jgi:hypothetical protein
MFTKILFMKCDNFPNYTNNCPKTPHFEYFYPHFEYNYLGIISIVYLNFAET